MAEEEQHMQSTLQGVAAAALLALLTSGSVQAQDAHAPADEPVATPEAAEETTAPAEASDEAPATEDEGDDNTNEAAAPDVAGDPAAPEVLEVVRDYLGV